MRCMHCPTSESGPVALPSPGPRAVSIRGLPSSPVRRWRPPGMRSATYRPTPSAPPGIPNLMAGEVVTPEAIEFLQATIRVPFGMY